MKYHKQLVSHEPPVQYGDCWRTCIACLLDRDSPKEIPHFAGELHDPNESHLAMKNYLTENYGYTIVTVPFVWDVDFESFLYFTKIVVTDNIPWILTGESTNKVNHSVIVLDGEIIHDPSVNNVGIKGPAIQDDNDINYYWMELLVCL